MSQYSKDMVQMVGTDTSGKWMSTEKVEKLIDDVIRGCIANVKVWETDSRNHISYMLKHQYGVDNEGRN